MGYFIENLKDIANVTEPARFSLSANPNFAEFEAIKKEPEKIVFTLTVTNIGTMHNSRFYIIEKYTGVEHVFQGYNLGQIPSDGDNPFLLSSTSFEADAINIAYSFKKNSYLSANFDITTEGTVIRLTSKTADPDPAYLFTYRAGNGNFLVSEGNTSNFKNVSTFIEIGLNFHNCGYAFIRNEVHGIKIYENVSAFSIIEENTRIEHKFEGTSDFDKVGPGVFYIGSVSQYGVGWQFYPEKTVETLKNCLMQNEFIRDNFELNQSIIKDSKGTLSLGASLNIKSKGTGEKYAFTIKRDERFFSISGDPSEAIDSDSFSEGHSPVELHLELYKDTGVFPGTNNAPDEKNMGSYVTTLTKSYANNPLWFNVNILESKDYAKDFLNEENQWFNTGTVRDFRFTAKRLIADKTRYENSLFYYSDVFYAVNGYQRTLETNDLSAYVYDTSKEVKAKPLTTQPELFHIEGQTQYFNFLLSDADHENEQGGNLAVTYRILSQSGRFLDEKVMHTRPKHLFHAVNTIRLDIDGVVAEYPNAGQVEVCLSRSLPDEDDYIAVTEALKFRILPSCLHKVNDFAFLNSLGGWSSFNFAGTDQSEFKTKTNTIFKTHTPDKTVSSELEAVFSKDVEEQFSVQTMPVTRDVAEWLRELSASKAVYELSTKRYVIVDDLVIKPNSKDDLFRLDMKYRYSDTYNAK